MRSAGSDKKSMLIADIKSIGTFIRYLEKASMTTCQVWPNAALIRIPINYG